MAHKFQLKNLDRFLESRREFFSPGELLTRFSLQEGETVADIGCGPGFFTLPAARIVGKGGRIYGLDISPEMLKLVEKRAQEQGVDNITLIETDNYNLQLPDHSISFGLLSTVLHEVEEHEQFLREIDRVLQDEGRLIVIEWQKQDSSSGPPRSERIDSYEMEELLDNRGMSVFRREELGENFYAIGARKNP